MASWTSIAGSWGCVAGAVVLGWLYYSKDGSRPQRIGRSQSSAGLEPFLKESMPQNKVKKSNKGRKKAESSASEATVEPVATANISEPELKQRKNANASAKSSAIETVSQSKPEKETDTDIKEFARQMSKAKEGTSFAGRKKDESRVRTQKQSKIKDYGNSDLQSSSASTSVIDVEDDVSSVSSPGLTAVSLPQDNTGVADMLEKAGPGPVSLRITEPTNPQPIRQQHVKKEQVVETKKQRQKRLAREREKEINRELEAQRKKDEEKQRRTAREAEGRPAKNGNGWTYDSGLPANAWSGGKTSTAAAPPIINGGLLDTTEEPVSLPSLIENAAPLSNGVSNGTNGHHTSNGLNSASANKGAFQSSHDLPSEEEQLRLLQEQNADSEWTTVAEPKRGKRKNGETTGIIASQTSIVKQNNRFASRFPSEVSADDY